MTQPRIRTWPATLDDAAPFVLASLLALVAFISMVADSCRGANPARPAPAEACSCEVSP